MNNMDSLLEDLLVNAGFPNVMGSLYCNQYLAAHKNVCAGCEYESSCFRMIALCRLVALIELAKQVYMIDQSAFCVEREVELTVYLALKICDADRDVSGVETVISEIHLEAARLAEYVS